MAKELTLEEALKENASLNERIKELEKENKALKVDEKKVVSLTEKVKEQEKHIKALKANEKQAVSISKEVPGTYKSEKHDVEIRFAKGCVKTRLGAEMIDSATIIENKNGEYTDFLDALIEKRAGIIEVINQ